MKRHLGPDRLSCWIAHDRDGKPLSGLLGWRLGDKFTVEYPGDFLDARTVGANQLLYWHVMQAVRAMGCSTFSFGRTGLNNTGLLSYKRHWGTVEEDLKMVLLPKARVKIIEPDPLSYRLGKSLIAHSPPLVQSYRGILLSPSGLEVGDITSCDEIMSTVEHPLGVTFHAGPPGDWDGFVMLCEPAHFEQTSWWANVESMDGWNAKYVVARDMGRIVAGAMVLVRRQSKVGRVGYIFRGPLTCPELSDSVYLQRFLATVVKSFARRERLVLLTVVPAYDGTALASTFLNMGFLRHPRSLPPSGLPPGTITVDLRREPGVIEQSFRCTLRKQIKRARKKGVVVKLGTAEDLELFWEMHLELCRRRGMASNVPGFGYVCRVWQEFRRLGRAWLFNAILEEEVLCSLICLGVGKWFYAWRIGWAPRSEKAYPTQAAFAQAIRTAAEAGYQFFDFMEIHPDDVASIERGEELKTPTSGITFFKMGFGGRPRTLPPSLDWFPNPVLRLFMRNAGLRLFSSAYFLKIVRLLSPTRPLALD